VEILFRIKWYHKHIHVLHYTLRTTKKRRGASCVFTKSVRTNEWTSRKASNCTAWTLWKLWSLKSKGYRALLAMSIASKLFWNKPMTRSDPSQLASPHFSLNSTLPFTHLVFSTSCASQKKLIISVICWWPKP